MGSEENYFWKTAKERNEVEEEEERKPFDPKIEQVCVDACKIEGVKVLNTYTHQFDPYGVTVNLTLGESHLSCHTWPEKNCVSFDIFTCGNKNPRSVAWWLLNYFDSDDYVMNDYAR